MELFPGLMMMVMACSRRSTPVQLRADELHLNSLGRAQQYISFTQHNTFMSQYIWVHFSFFCRYTILFVSHNVQPSLPWGWLRYAELPTGMWLLFATLSVSLIKGEYYLPSKVQYRPQPISFIPLPQPSWDEIDNSHAMPDNRRMHYM